MSEVKRCPTCHQRRNPGRPIIGFRLDRDLKAFLKQRALSQGKVLSKVVEEIVIDGIAILREQAVNQPLRVQPLTAQPRQNPKADLSDLKSAADRLTVPISGKSVLKTDQKTGTLRD